ncbi:tubulin folding cofactor E [Rhizoctonia solani]|uniref:Tubulin folding cofactor E n=1 Tax=Rhizoctonia solani TaxID=456999 RepID=A0A0K6FNK6_9AGAM|nr:tubulin folding cofactor E [Rhizoctonia solani]
MDDLSVGQRIRIGEDYGTVLFIGDVAGTTGTWLGIEWDDGSKKGKHSGERNGVQYFTCRTPNSGSFVRPNAPGLTKGIGIDTALVSKYIDTFQSGGVETVVLGSSNGVILVEGPRLDKVRAKFSQIERLRNISLNKYDVSNVGNPQVVSKLCQSVQNLDLSRTLLGNWNEIADILRCTPNLFILELNFNRIQLTAPLNTTNFPKLTRLRLNSTMIDWAEACEVLAYLPNLQDLQLGHNQLKHLHPSSKINTPEALPSLTTLNLDSNFLGDWASSMASCSLIPQLRNLMLPSNKIATIPHRTDTPTSKEPTLLLHYLALSDNPISNWGDVDSLVTWFPELHELSISLEMLASGIPPGASRNFVIARLPLLSKLNGTEITERERTDAELFYLSWIGRDGQLSEADTQVSHPRWKELAIKYNTSTEKAKPISENLGSHMISVSIVRVSEPIIKQQPVIVQNTKTTLRILPTMTLKVFGMKLKKAMKLSSQIDANALWILSTSESGEVIPLRTFDVDPLHDLTWSGVEDGTLIGIAV